MADQGRSGRVAEAAAILQQKRLLTDQVRMRFARFGDDVLAIVLGYALQPKRMPVLLQKCQIRSFPDLENQLGALWSYISEHGPRDFVKRVTVKKRDKVKPVDVDKMDGDFDPTTSSLDDLVEQARRDGMLDSKAEAKSVRNAIISVEGYSGPDRRRGGDRRMGADRRASIDAISKNKRFGGDRRKRPKGRRRSDFKG